MNSNREPRPEADLPSRLSIGVVIERRASANLWEDHIWSATEVLPGWTGREDDAEGWLVLEKGEGFKRWLAGPLAIELFKKETPGYKVNLGQPTALIYVILRRNDDPDTHHEIDLFHVTACPYEADSYNESGDEIVCGVAMPLEIAAWVAKFAELHHVEVEFKKRKQKSKHHAIPERGRPGIGGRRG